RHRATDATENYLALRRWPGFDADQLPYKNLWAHRNSVIHPGNPRRQPGGTFGFFAFRPRSHGTSKDDLAAMCLDRDAVGVDQRAAPECFLDLLLDLLRPRFEPSLAAGQVADTLHCLDP